MSLFNFTPQITQSINDASANLSSSAAKYVGALSDIKGRVGDVKGGAQGAIQAIKDVVKEGQAGFEDFQEMVGLRDQTEIFLKKKAEVQTPVPIPVTPDPESYKANLPKSASEYQDMNSLRAYLASVGISRTNRFRIEFTPPKMFKDAWIADKGSSRLKMSDLGDLESLQLGWAIESFSIPGINFDTKVTNYGGYKTQIADDYNVDEVSMVLRCFGDMAQKAFFDRWANSVYNFRNGGVRFFNMYSTDVYIYQQDESNNDVYCVMMRGAYPKIGSSLDLNAAAQSDYHRLSIQWVCEKVIPIDLPYTDTPYEFNKAKSDVPPPQLMKQRQLSRTEQFIQDNFGDTALEYADKAGSFLGL